MTSRFWHLFAVLAFSALAASPAWAQEAGTDGWEFSATPFIWFVNLDGDITVDGNKTKVDTDIFELIDESDSIVALEGHFEARKGKVGGFFEATYMDLTMDGSSGPLEGDVEMTYILADLAGFYEVASVPLGGPDERRRLAVEVMAGGRYTSLDVDLDLSGPIGGLRVNGSESWVDPIVGGRVHADITERLMFTSRADVGGFGGGSDITWNLVGLLGYEFALLGAPATALGGFRVLYQDYENGNGADKFAYDMYTYGPILGLSIQF